ncbi:beta-lactamase/transpeptidase-like protein [Lindgomyces ingoldianus]|uniref:Beta-lactamase/transpeptidase-like protein n=1 Tax=Lindgomyces ingoldianus TaxID=673940 RepID=A0ACB6QGD2_9PLEO|nr:beta-lactamase/transpeptidase-like protein [Lindgomyces ingoldianus]KAF2465945.1 beta-lactamase/transpeptidase-like protein [Lindgomyces ingoldianus]
MDDLLVARLKAQNSQISRFHSLSGSPALSLGVFHQGKVIHTAHFGRKDVSKSSPPNDDSVYYVASMLKILTVSTVAKLVHDGILGWDVPVREYLPGFNREDDIGRLTTLRDLIANRTGLAVAAFFWTQQNGELLLGKNEMVHMACHLKAVKPFRASFLYSQWNYILVQIIIETVTGKPFGTLIQETMITPLGLKNTTFSIPHGENVVAPHAVRDNGTAAKIEINPWTDESGITAGAGGKASLNDLLTIYIELLSAHSHQSSHNVNTTPGSPFTHMRTIFEPQIKARSSGVEVYHHTMSIPGFLGSMFLVPRSNSGVIVLTNATPKLDATDLSAQCLLGVLLGEPRPNLVRMAEMGQKMSLAIYRQIASSLEQSRTLKPPSLPLQMYAGVYTNSAGNFFLKVDTTQRGLHITVQNKARVAYDLFPYDGNVFYWPVSRERELCEKAMWPHLLPAFHIITFGVNEGGVDCLRWHHDPLDGPEVFAKDTRRSRL